MKKLSHLTKLSESHIHPGTHLTKDPFNGNTTYPGSHLQYIVECDVYNSFLSKVYSPGDKSLFKERYKKVLISQEKDLPLGVCQLSHEFLLSCLHYHQTRKG